MFRSVTAIVLVISLGLLFAGCSGTAGPAVSSVQVSEAPAVANDGYDMTAYFALGKAVRGVPQLSLVWNGATYLFANQEGREMFTANPAKYIPGFGSHCPVALAKGKDVDGKPTSWRVHNEKLYFFGSEDAAGEFDKDPEATLAKAKENEPASGNGSSPAR